jgi:exodeoxyribonuclease VII large subunit
VQRIDELSLRLDTRSTAVVAEARLRIKAAEAKLGSIRPDKVIELLRGRIELFHGRLFRIGISSTERLSTTVTQLRERLRRAIPNEKIFQHRLVVDALGGRLLIGATRGVEDARNKVMGLGVRLESINPQRVLERGYSIVRVKGKNVRSIDEVVDGDGMEISVSDGLVLGTVTGRSKER